MNKRVIELCLNDKVVMNTPLGIIVCRVTSLAWSFSEQKVLVGARPIDYADAYFNPFMKPDDKIEVIESERGGDE